MSLSIVLSEHEVTFAAQVGVRRRIEAMKMHLKDNHASRPLADPWTLDVEGACGEMAVAKALDIYWDGAFNTFHRADVGSLHVRTAAERAHRLIVREQDEDHSIYVLVVGQAPRFDVVGWLYGIDAKNREWLSAPNGRAAAYFVPQNALADIGSLERR